MTGAFHANKAVKVSQTEFYVRSVQLNCDEPVYRVVAQDWYDVLLDVFKFSCKFNKDFSGNYFCAH